MMKRNKIDQWHKIFTTEGLGLITINESPISTISLEQQLEFYEVTDKSLTTRTVFGDDEEVDELEALLEAS